MACKRKGTPGSPCCGTPVGCESCFTIRGCNGEALPGALVEVYQPPAPFGDGSLVDSCTTASDGRCCIDFGVLGFFSGLKATVTPPDTTQYRILNQALMPQNCGREYTYALAAGSEATGSGVSGRVSVTANWCSFGLHSPTTIQIKRVSDGALLGTASSGTAVFNSLPLGVALEIFVGMTVAGVFYGRTYPSFTLTCEASVLITHDAAAACSHAQVVTPIGCGSAAQRVCCKACGLRTIPTLLDMDDPANLDPLVGDPGSNASFPNPSASCGDRGASALALSSYGASWTRSGPTQYQMNCEADGSVVLSKRAGPIWVSAANPYGAELCASWHSGLPQPFGYPAAPQSFEWDRIPASAVTCNPFSATFLMPARAVQLWIRRFVGTNGGTGSSALLYPCGICTVGSHTIVVTEP
jgi:hypothetical protein